VGNRESTVEGMVIDTAFWTGKRVLVTGHTGFKGAWLSLWLTEMGAVVSGYALDPPTTPNLFTHLRLDKRVASVIGDLRDPAHVRRAVAEHRPDVVFHLAAQPLVRESYRDPVGTYATNVMGLVHLFEALRETATARVMVNVTSDKCYENREWVWGYRETDAMGGYDPYSSSKGCAELVTAAYRRSFFQDGGMTLASARAGNVIGGGDWADDRLVPDAIRAFGAARPLRIRNPHAVRPWQHVLDPLNGYMMLARRLWDDPGCAEGWNFGPPAEDARNVAWVVDRLCSAWGEGAAWERDGDDHPHEASLLSLDCAKARNGLGWHPVWHTEQALEETIRWYRAASDGESMVDFSLQQITRFSTQAASAA